MLLKHVRAVGTGYWESEQARVWTVRVNPTSPSGCASRRGHEGARLPGGWGPGPPPPPACSPPGGLGRTSGEALFPDILGRLKPSGMDAAGRSPREHLEFYGPERSIPCAPGRERGGGVLPGGFGGGGSGFLRMRCTLLSHSVVPDSV